MRGIITLRDSNTLYSWIMDASELLMSVSGSGNHEVLVKCLCNYSGRSCKLLFNYCID